MANYRYWFQALLTKVNPSTQRLALAKELPGEVRDWLQEHDYETAYPHTRLSGSYARDTAICDIKDVDVLLFLPEEQLDRTPESILRELRRILNDYPGAFAETTPQRRSVRLDFPDYSLYLDIVPAVAPKGTDHPLQIPDRRQQVWIDTDPLGYGKRLSKVNLANGSKVVPLIKLMKAWSDVQLPTRRLKSYALEVMVMLAVETGGITLEGSGLPRAFTDLVRYLHDRYMPLYCNGTESPRVSDPQTGRVITTGWERVAFESFMRRLITTVAAAERAMEEDDPDNGAEQWQRVFGDLWPSPEEVKTAARAESTTVAPGRTAIAATGAVIGSIAPAVVSRPTKFHGGRRIRIPRGPANRPMAHIGGMRAHFPGFLERIRPGECVVWMGTLQPTEDSPEYRLRIEYCRSGPPKVLLISPHLKKGAPHVYSDGSLCLYWPREWWWSDREPVAETIIPWTALWLYYYELWLVTDEWLGPSSPHGHTLKAGSRPRHNPHRHGESE